MSEPIKRTKKLRLYRKAPDGELIPYIFELDSTSKIIEDEYVDTRLQERMREDALRAVGLENAEAPASVTANMNKPVKIIRRIDGKDHEFIASDYDLNFAKWMLQSMPNPWPRTDSLRKDYFKEIEDLNNSGCSQCDQTQVTQKYKDKVRRLLET